MLKVLVLCEYSGRVRDSFIKLGHHAESVDILPGEGKHTERHFQGTVSEFLKLSPAHHFDLIIAFPPCTHLCSSGAHLWAKKKADGRQKEAIDFFMMIAGLNCEKIAIENPVGIMSTVWRKPDQYIQPWQFGEDASKKTGLWLKGLPKLEPTEIIKKARYANQTNSGQNKLSPSKDRAKIRSLTYLGIAEAMANQWGGRLND